MRVSVIITSYNQARYLRDAIDSVLNQTLKPAEILLCDDCSTADNTREILDGYALRYPNLIRVVPQTENRGVSTNRNAGFRIASGEFVTWLDGDDRFLRTKLEKELEAIDRSGSPIAYSDVYYTDEALNRFATRYQGQDLLEGDLFEAIATRKLPPPLMMLFARRLLDDVGYLDEDLPIYEDWEWKIRLAHRFEFAACPEPHYEYRQHADGLHNVEEEIHLNIMIEITRRALNLAASGSSPRATTTVAAIQTYATLLRMQRATHIENVKYRRDLEQAITGLDPHEAAAVAQTCIQLHEELDRTRGHLQAFKQENTRLLGHAEELRSLQETFREIQSSKVWRAATVARQAKRALARLNPIPRVLRR